jgi:hypothetical protein
MAETMKAPGKFQIVKGREFKCTFIIKEPGSSQPVKLNPGDSGSFTISSYGVAPKVIIGDLLLTLGTDADNLNGKMFLNMTAEETGILPADVEFGEDGFPIHPTCKGLIDADTFVTGKLYATVVKIYVQDMGE